MRCNHQQTMKTLPLFNFQRKYVHFQLPYLPLPFSCSLPLQTSQLITLSKCEMIRFYFTIYYMQVFPTKGKIAIRQRLNKHESSSSRVTDVSDRIKRCIQAPFLVLCFTIFQPSRTTTATSLFLIMFLLSLHEMLFKLVFQVLRRPRLKRKIYCGPIFM